MESNDRCEQDQTEMVKRLKKKKKNLGRVLSKQKDKTKKERLAAIKVWIYKLLADTWTAKKSL